MAGLVHELEKAALDDATPVSSLLRKALVVANKIGVADFETWARRELEGYGADETLPEYRTVHGAPKVFNPYHGAYQDLQCESAAFAKKISTMHLPMPIHNLEDHGSNPGGTWILSYAPESEHSLMKAMRGVRMKPSLHLSDSVIRTILDRVRTIVLQWALTLQRQGVIGEGMTFSENERSKASSIHIGTFIQGGAGSQQVQVNSPGASQQQGLSADQVEDLTKLVQLVATALDGNSTQMDELDELRAEIATIKAQANSPKPKRGVLRESLSSVRAILEGAAGEVLAAHLPTVMPVLVHLISSF
jgi:hypothetical protein